MRNTSNVTSAAESYLTIVFSVVEVMGVDRDLTVILLSGVHQVFSESAEGTVLQLLSIDTVLSRVEGAMWPGFSGKLLGYPRKSVAM